MGHPVVDEFATISSPIFLTPRALLGKIYNVGITLGHMRGSEMALDLGWPPLCVGVDRPASQLPTSWEEQLIEAITEPGPIERVEPEEGVLVKVKMPTHSIEVYRFENTTVVAVAESLLPRQLYRLCETVKTSVVVAVSVGNRVVRSSNAAPLTVGAVSENRLARIIESVASLESSPVVASSAPL